LFAVNPALAAENILSTMPDSLILADLDGKIIRVNPSMADFSGYSEGELLGKACMGLFEEETDGSNLMSELVSVREIRGYETTFKTKQGQTRTTLFSGSVVKSKRGQDIGFTMVFHDITSRKELEQKLVKAERFASIGELAGMIGHDLRNPLTSIQGAAYYLKVKYAKDLNDPGRDMLVTIERSIEYSNKIINDLLDYSRDIKLEKEETNPQILVLNARSLISHPENVKVINLTLDAPAFQVDIGKMTRVLVNIFKNAFDAMLEGGTLTITSATVGDNVEIKVQDTGVGMSEETLGRLWTPLFTTKAKGMGFGLPICKRIVEAHGGKLITESALGKGTSFTIVLPVKTTKNNAAIAKEDY
jgi:two-component system, NtrC family, sensor histidine kinase AtoS